MQHAATEERAKSDPKAAKKKGPTIETVRQRVVYEMHRLNENAIAVDHHTLVCIWAWAHEELYGVCPASELAGTNWFAAGHAALKFVREEFTSDYQRALAFVRWAIGREQKREAWRRKEGKEGGRLTWRQLFAFRDLVVEYRVAMGRMGVAC